MAANTASASSGGTKGQEFAFVGNVERIKAENFACAFDFFADGDGSFIEADADIGLFGDFGESAGDAAPGGSRRHVNVLAGGKDGFCTRPFSGAVSLAISVSNSKALAHRHDGNTVDGNRAVDDDFVADLRAAGMDAHTGLNGSDAGGVDEYFVAFAAVHHLGIAGHEGNAGGSAARCMD